ncbi:MAG: hypothetical protein E4H41_09685 [Gemmatimonadales bacterium]|jgi:hypothetical protein|nr:MAG: hypothetical protein E4H41_09685 [Gemmatimonadales bacterium]
MSLYKPQQRHITVRDRELHFVSYEAHPADPRRDAEAEPEMWYLMRAGRRWAVMPRNPDQAPEDTDELLQVWAEANAFGDEVVETATVPIVGPRTRRRGSDNWWGPSEGRQAS